eukprot:UN3962
MVLALNVSVYFCKLLPLHMNGNLPVGIGMHVFAMICDLMLKICETKKIIIPKAPDRHGRRILFLCAVGKSPRFHHYFTDLGITIH